MNEQKKRVPIRLSDTPMGVVLKMSEGNPGAATVLGLMLHGDHVLKMLSLDDMNIRGSQIWVGYKDYCDQDLDTFLDCIERRDQGMVDAINAQCYHPESAYDGYQEQAVTSGASFESLPGQKPGVRGMGL